MRRAVIGDEPILRELRLQAMRDSPAAFGSTYERELGRTTRDWQQWMSPGVTFILEGSGAALGIVAGQHDPVEPAVVHLMAMWVHPDARGSGAADELVGAIVKWAEDERAATIRLAVIKSNTRAQRCYERCGFDAAGDEVTPDRDLPTQLRMERRLR